jgi:uncharacterized protein YyaL (SSP411 family)
MPNRLADESSPYLLQHANNPVDWYPWGDEAFARARQEDLPIFLSVGYSACHWCHVMEHESFEDDEVAAILKEHFVSIKVDREERPDVDSLYMNSVQMLTGSGGWPMSVFLTPALEPFYGGTYFPPDSRSGRPGFKDVLRHVARVYREERPKVTEVAEQLTGYLAVSLTPENTDLPDVAVFDVVHAQAAQTFDSTFGGFGQAPKFPHPMDLSVLLRHWKRSGETLALDMALVTLQKMAEGGMYDQVGGGFHRYSVDRQWLVPHFEKMLYDNGLLTRSYLDAYQVSGKSFFLDVARDILDYVVREMSAPEGGYYSATDADSEGEEGKFFVWTPEEIEALLGRDEARLFCLYYNATVGGNFENSTSILNITRPLEEIAQNLKIDLDDARRIIDDGRAKLYEERSKRVAPFRDEKLIVAWNGLMLSAMARGYQITGDLRYRESAERTATFIEENCVHDGVVHRIYKDGGSKIPGFLDDYACLAEALVDLYEATFHLPYLERAVTLVDSILEEFSDPGDGGLFYASGRHGDLLHRRKEPLDNATPSGTWVTASTLARLERLTGKAEYRQRAEEILRGFGSLVEKAPMAFASGLIALDFLQGPPLEIAVVGDPDAPETRDMLAAIHRRFLPTRVVAGSPDFAGESAASRVPLLADRGLVDGKTTVYVCENFSCQTPITDVETLERALSGYVR